MNCLYIFHISFSSRGFKRVKDNSCGRKTQPLKLTDCHCLTGHPEVTCREHETPLKTSILLDVCKGSSNNVKISHPLSIYCFIRVFPGWKKFYMCDKLKSHKVTFSFTCTSNSHQLHRWKLYEKEWNSAGILCVQPPQINPAHIRIYFNHFLVKYCILYTFSLHFQHRLMVLLGLICIKKICFVLVCVRKNWQWN